MTTEILSCPTGHNSHMQDSGAALGPFLSARKCSARSTLCIQQEPSHRTNTPPWNKSLAGNRAKCPQRLSLATPLVSLPVSSRGLRTFAAKDRGSGQQPRLCKPHLSRSQSLSSAVARGKLPQTTVSKHVCKRNFMAGP